MNPPAEESQAFVETLERIRSEAGGDPARMQEVLNQPAADGKATVAQYLRGWNAYTPPPEVRNLLDALVKGSDGQVVGARLALAASGNRLTAEQLESELVDLRTQARMRFALDTARDASSKSSEQDAVSLAFVDLERGWRGTAKIGIADFIQNAPGHRDTTPVVMKEGTPPPPPQLKPEWDHALSVLEGLGVVPRSPNPILVAAKNWRVTPGMQLSQLVAHGQQLMGQVRALYQQAMDKRGLYAELRDWSGNKEEQIVDLAKAGAEKAYKELVELGHHPGLEQSLSDAEHEVQSLQWSVVRLKRALQVYDAATQAAFHRFVDFAVNLVAMALSLTPGGPLVVGLRVAAGLIGTKMVLLQDEYRADMLVDDLEQAVGAAVGGAAGSSVGAALVGRAGPLLSSAAGTVGLEVSADVGALAAKAVTSNAEIYGSIAGAKGGLPSAEEFAQMAVLGVATEKVKAALRGAKAHPERGIGGRVTEPEGGGGGRTGTASESHSAGSRSAPTWEEAAAGVRLARDIPGGGRLKLLATGRLAVCHSPCAYIEDRFGALLDQNDPATGQSYRRELNAIAERERAAIAANDRSRRSGPSTTPTASTRASTRSGRRGWPAALASPRLRSTSSSSWRPTTRRPSSGCSAWPTATRRGSARQGFARSGSGPSSLLWPGTWAGSTSSWNERPGSRAPARRRADG